MHLPPHQEQELPSHVGGDKNHTKLYCRRVAQLFSHDSPKSTSLRSVAPVKKLHLPNEHVKHYPARHGTRFCLIMPVVAAVILATVGCAESAIDAHNTLNCHRRQYRYKITETDASGRSCWDYVNVMSCWGRCESHEIADWKFPYKRSHHPVCQHASTRQSEVVLRNCDPGVAPGTEVHRFTEAAACACSLCRSSETSCEGLRFRGVRRAPQGAGPPEGRGRGSKQGKAGASEGTGIAKRERQSGLNAEVVSTDQAADAAMSGRPRGQTSALMVASQGNFGNKLDGALALTPAHGALRRGSEGALVKKNLEDFMAILGDEGQAPYPGYEDEFLYADVHAPGTAGLAGAQPPNEIENFPLESFDEAATVAKLFTLRKQLHDDERRPSLKDVARMVPNYRELERQLGEAYEEGAGDQDGGLGGFPLDGRWER